MPANADDDAASMRGQPATSLVVHHSGGEYHASDVDDEIRKIYMLPHEGSSQRPQARRDPNDIDDGDEKIGPQEKKKGIVVRLMPGRFARYTTDSTSLNMSVHAVPALPGPNTYLDNGLSLPGVRLHSLDIVFHVQVIHEQSRVISPSIPRDDCIGVFPECTFMSSPAQASSY